MSDGPLVGFMQVFPVFPQEGNQLVQGANRSLHLFDLFFNSRGIFLQLPQGEVAHGMGHGNVVASVVNKCAAFR